MFFTSNCRSYFSKKMANFASVPNHPPTTDMWPIGDGIITQPKLNIAMWNVNGIRSVLKKGSLASFISKKQPDIVCLNETKIDLKGYNKDIKNGGGISEGYHEYWNFCKVSGGYSGVLTLSKFKPLRIIEDLPTKQTYSLEGRLICLEYEKFYLLNVYKPSSGRELERLSYRVNEYDQLFIDYVQQLQLHKPVLIAGDMNVAHHQIDIANPKTNTRTAGFTLEERNKFTQLLKNHFVDSFRAMNPKTVKYTWWSHMNQARQKNIGWRLDYVLVDQRIKILESQIYNEFMGSDHCPISTQISIP